ncbi:MAG: protoporphyrinogen oxidase [Rhodospirillales bacterium]
MSVDVAIVGGGISGLACAYDLKRQGHDVVVLERQANPGGKAYSERIGGFLMEHGPSTVNSASKTAGSFSEQLGLDGERCELGDGVEKRYLVGGGRLRSIPIHPLGFLASNYLSLKSRLRLICEIAVPRGGGGKEETVAEYCTRRFGAEFTERVIDPMVGGIYAGKADELSISAVFPKLVEMEEEFGSISYGMMRRRRQGGEMPSSRLFSWRGGIGTLPKALAKRLGGAVCTGVTVRRVEERLGEYHLDMGPGGSFKARAVVFATQPHVTAQLLEDIDRPASEAAGGIDAPPLSVVFFGFKRTQVDHPLDGLGFLTPRSEGFSLSGAQFCSTMFAGRSNEGEVSVAGYIGGSRAPDMARLPKDDLIALAGEEFSDLLGCRGEPLVARVRQWPRGLPQYRLGHGKRTDSLKSIGERRPGMFVTGNYFKGPSVAVCLSMAHQTSSRVHGYLLGLEGAPGKDVSIGVVSG